jgi:hypothetical protein
LQFFSRLQETDNQRSARCSINARLPIGMILHTNAQPAYLPSWLEIHGFEWCFMAV